MSHYSKELHYTGDRWSGYERLRVDAAQTGFFEGREFRSFFELNMAGGTSRTFKFVAPCEFVLFGQDLLINAGAVRYEAFVGSTEGDTFNVLVPVIGKNRMLERRAPYYSPQVVISTGGTISGGTNTDLALLDTTNQSGGIGVSLASGEERGLPAGTYYIRLTATGTVTGVFRLWWEERARHPDWKLDESKTN